MGFAVRRRRLIRWLLLTVAFRVDYFLPSVVGVRGSVGGFEAIVLRGFDLIHFRLEVSKLIEKFCFFFLTKILLSGEKKEKQRRRRRRRRDDWTER